MAGTVFQVAPGWASRILSHGMGMLHGPGNLSTVLVSFNLKLPRGHCHSNKYFETYIFLDHLIPEILKGFSLEVT